jgi:hypothetical protein
MYCRKLFIVIAESNISFPAGGDLAPGSIEGTAGQAVNAAPLLILKRRTTSSMPAGGCSPSSNSQK